MTAAISSTVDTAKIQKAIADQGVNFTREEEDQRGAKADAAAHKRANTNRALALSRGKSADVTDRGSIGDDGTQRVATLGTGIGGSHGDGYKPSGKRARAYRAGPATT